MFDKIDDFFSDLKSEIANLERENYKLKRKLEELQKEKEQPKQKNKKWVPQIDGVYYMVDNGGGIQELDWEDMEYDQWRLSQGNCFETEEQAEQYLENLKTKAELKALADELNGDEVIDWIDESQKKFNIYYDYAMFELRQKEMCDNRSQGTIYCLDSKFLKEAIDRIGEERLIEMIKAGV